MGYTTGSLTQRTTAQADLEARQAVGSNALPSCAFFTFVNTAQALNCAAFSLDSSRVVGAQSVAPE